VLKVSLNLNQPTSTSSVAKFVDRHFYPSTLTDFDETWSQSLL